MSFSFSAEEILQLAIKIENNGARFYRQAAERVSCGKTKEILLDLAGMEHAHEKSFEQLLQGLGRDQKGSPTFDPEGETALYLESLANSRIFSPKAPPLPQDDSSCSLENIRDILQYAIEREEDSIIFYLGMKDLAASEEDKCKVDEIIHEEMLHIRLLNNQIRQLGL